jgi:ubiquinone/menaquinone biosynthesis C-methylase UbiE
MLATATTITPTNLDVRYVQGRAACLPFTDDVFDLVFTTLSLGHWTDPSAGIAEIGRVLTPGGLLVLADVLPNGHRRGPALPMLRQRHRPGRPGSCPDRPPPGRHRQRSHPLVPAA